MAFIPVLNTAMCELRFTLFGQQIENVLYFEHTGSISTLDLQNLATALDLWVANYYLLAGLSQDIAYREVFVTDLTTATSPTASASVNAGDIGTLTQPSLPGGTCIVASFRTAGRGRSSRGRNYISGLGESTVTGNQVALVITTQFITAYEELINNPPTDWQWVVVSRYTGGNPRASGVTEPITSVTFTDLNVDSQRRRLTGRGT